MRDDFAARLAKKLSTRGAFVEGLVRSLVSTGGLMPEPPSPVDNVPGDLFAEFVKDEITRLTLEVRVTDEQGRLNRVLEPVRDDDGWLLGCFVRFNPDPQVHA